MNRRVRQLGKEGTIDGATKFHNLWIIPEKTEKPADRRIKSGKYIKPSNELRGGKNEII